jgi:hypothetical protein
MPFRHVALSYAWSIIFSENWVSTFGIMLYGVARGAADALSSADPGKSCSLS